MQVTNNEKLKFQSLESEQYRQYLFPNAQVVTIDFPTHINVSKSGGHRILDAQGISHYVPAGWIELIWKVKEGKPAFDF